MKQWGEARGKDVAQFVDIFQSGELLCQMPPQLLQLIFVGGDVSIGMDLYDYLHNVKVMARYLFFIFYRNHDMFYEGGF